MQQTTKKKTNRYFNDIPTTRLIVACEQSIIDRVDIHIRADRVTRGNRAEFVRQAIIEKLQREIEQKEIERQFKEFENEVSKMDFDSF